VPVLRCRASGLYDDGAGGGGVGVGVSGGDWRTRESVQLGMRWRDRDIVFQCSVL